MFILRVTTLLVIPALLSCSHLGGAGQAGNVLPGQSFSAYAESVFRLQNRLTSEVMMLPDTNGKNNPSAIVQAEQRMHQACQALNDYATQKTEGLGISLWLPMRVRQSAVACENAAKTLQAALAGL